MVGIDGRMDAYIDSAVRRAVAKLSTKCHALCYFPVSGTTVNEA
jgi:hypothetical protein